MASLIRLVVTASSSVRAGLRRAENEINQFHRRLNASALRAARTAGRAIGDGLSNGLGNGLRTAMSNPFVAAAVLAIAVGVAALVGAALAGALVLAIGGAFVAMGVMLALQTKGVKEKWSKTLNELKPLFIDAASGMLPVIEHARVRFEEIGKKFAPHFKEALDKAAPHLTTFMDDIISGFAKLGQRAAAPLEEAFNVFLAAFGPDMEEFLAGLGDSLGALARTVRDHSTEISMALRAVISLITFAVDAINFFANAWVMGIRTSSQAIGVLLAGIGLFVDAVFAVFEQILAGADKAFSWIPGVGDKIAKAKEDFSGFRDKVRDDMDNISRKFTETGERLDHMNRERILKVNIKSWENQLRIARANLKKTSDQKAVAKIKANIDDLKRKVASARGELNALNGKTAHTYVITHMQARKEGAHGTQLGYAHGGVVGRAATGGVRSNMTLVGEQGPELIDLAPGSHVKSNSDSRRLMAAGGGGGGQPMVVQVVLDGRQLAEVLVDPMRGVIQSKGGSVQKVLGQRGRG